MNDGFTDISFDTGNGTDGIVDSEVSERFDTSTDTEQAVTDSDFSLPDSLGNDFLLSSSTTDNAEVFAPSETPVPETGEEIQETVGPDSVTGSEGGVSSDSVNYIPELEYIDYLLNTQLDEMNAVQSVSGNSINVSFDDTTCQTLQDLARNQLVSIENQEIIINLVSCVLLAVVLDFLIASARRTAKKMHGRKE